MIKEYVYKISDQNKLRENLKDLMSTLEKEAKEQGADIGDIINKMNNTKSTEEVCLLIQEAIDKILKAVHKNNK